MSKWLKRVSLIILFVVAFVLGVTFTSENNQPATLFFFGYPLPELQLGLWVLLSLFLGGFIGLFLSFLPWLWGKKSISVKERKIQQLEKELIHLRNSALKS